MVEIQGRFKRIESVFNVAAARARTPCDNSSGSDQSPEDTMDLSDLVAVFIESEGQMIKPVKNDQEEVMDSSSDKDLEDVKERLRKLLEGLYGGEERMRITAATEVAGKFVGDSSTKRQLMAFLRNKGFDSGKYLIIILIL